MNDCSKVDIANQVLATFSPQFQAEYDRYLILKWTDGRGKEVARRWSCAPNFYPPFHRLMGCGGTQTQAIAQLMRWCQGKTVLPLSTWRYWGSDTVRLWRTDEKRGSAISLLEASGYPLKPICQFCGQDVSGRSWDWFYLPKEGPGCWGEKCQERTHD